MVGSSVFLPLGTMYLFVKWTFSNRRFGIFIHIYLFIQYFMTFFLCLSN